MKLADYAREVGVSYRTAWRWWKSGALNGYQLPSGTIIINVDAESSALKNAEAKKSSGKNRENKTSSSLQESEPPSLQPPSQISAQQEFMQSAILRLENRLNKLEAALQQGEIERQELKQELELASSQRAELMSMLNLILTKLEFLIPSSAQTSWQSEVGMDYSQLDQLLATGRWQEADQYTWLVMLIVADREAEGWLRLKDIENFPCRDLHTIDQLWTEYSSGRFGFNVQRRILFSLENNYTDFCDRVGWRQRENWLNYDELSFSAHAPEGHLPVIVWRRRACYGVGTSTAADSLAAIAHRLEQCQKISSEA
ncbi:MAG: GUN4 domain-containing protein [Hormoscilla sp.]